MLKAAGAVLVILSCTAIGYGKSLNYSARLRELEEIQKMVYFLLGEITYRREALPEAMVRVADKIRPPLSQFSPGSFKSSQRVPGRAFFQDLCSESQGVSKGFQSDKRGSGRTGPSGRGSGVYGYYHAGKYHKSIFGRTERRDQTDPAGSSGQEKAVSGLGPYGGNVSGHPAGLRRPVCGRWHDSDKSLI